MFLTIDFFTKNWSILRRWKKFIPIIMRTHYFIKICSLVRWTFFFNFLKLKMPKNARFSQNCRFFEVVFYKNNKKTGFNGPKSALIYSKCAEIGSQSKKRANFNSFEPFSGQIFRVHKLIIFRSARPWSFQVEFEHQCVKNLGILIALFLILTISVPITPFFLWLLNLAIEKLMIKWVRHTWISGMQECMLTKVLDNVRKTSKCNGLNLTTSLLMFFFNVQHFFFFLRKRRSNFWKFLRLDKKVVGRFPSIGGLRNIQIKDGESIHQHIFEVKLLNYRC